MDYITAREAAEKWGVSERRINQYCAEGRIPGAERFGGAWAIPAAATPANRKRKPHPQVRSKRRSCFPASCP